MNVGRKNGLVACLEDRLGRSLHIIACSLHQNELQFRAIFKLLDGPTESPNSISGPIGKLCQKNYHMSSPRNFETVSGPLDNYLINNNVKSDLSNDQRLLYEYCVGISSGCIATPYQHRKIGPISHSRWLTLAVRVLCLYTRGVDNVNEEILKKIVLFIVQVYAPNWFRIKFDNKFYNQPRYIFDAIQRIKTQEDCIKKAAFKSIQQNGYGL